MVDFFCYCFKGRNCCDLAKLRNFCISMYLLSRTTNISPWAHNFFWLPSGDKISYGFLLTSGCLVSRKVWWAVRMIVAFAQNWCFLQTRMDQRWAEHMKINLDYFQIQKWILQTVRTEKVDEKNEVICLANMFPC